MTSSSPCCYLSTHAPHNPNLPHPLRRVRAWIFDLDNTLYPSECNLFAQVDQRMGAFIAEFLGVSVEEAKRVQKDYYYRYGTTLAGLMREHKLPPERFLDFVHDIDLARMPSGSRPSSECCIISTSCSQSTGRGL